MVATRLPGLPTVRLYRFGSFELQTNSGELLRNGFRVRLQQQPHRLLTVLLEHAGEPVSRERLQQTLWPSDTFVDFDIGLNTAIRKLRRALGDQLKHPRFIETLARRGYRFLAPVALFELDPTVPPSQLYPASHWLAALRAPAQAMAVESTGAPTTLHETVPGIPHSRRS